MWYYSFADRQKAPHHLSRKFLPHWTGPHVIVDKLSPVAYLFNKYQNVKGVHYSLHLDEQFTVVFMTVSHSPQMLLSFKVAFEPFFCEKYIYFYSRF